MHEAQAKLWRIARTLTTTVTQELFAPPHFSSDTPYSFKCSTGIRTQTPCSAHYKYHGGRTFRGRHTHGRRGHPGQPRDSKEISEGQSPCDWKFLSADLYRSRTMPRMRSAQSLTVKIYNPQRYGPNCARPITAQLRVDRRLTTGMTGFGLLIEKVPLL